MTGKGWIFDTIRYSKQIPLFYCSFLGPSESRAVLMRLQNPQSQVYANISYGLAFLDEYLSGTSIQGTPKHVNFLIVHSES